MFGSCWIQLTLNGVIPSFNYMHVVELVLNYIHFTCFLHVPDILGFSFKNKYEVRLIYGWTTTTTTSVPELSAGAVVATVSADFSYSLHGNPNF